MARCRGRRRPGKRQRLRPLPELPQQVDPPGRQVGRRAARLLRRRQQGQSRLAPAEIREGPGGAEMGPDTGRPDRDGPPEPGQRGVVLARQPRQLAQLFQRLEVPGVAFQRLVEQALRLPGLLQGAQRGGHLDQRIGVARLAAMRAAEGGQRLGPAGRGGLGAAEAHPGLQVAGVAGDQPVRDVPRRGVVAGVAELGGEFEPSAAGRGIGLRRAAEAGRRRHAVAAVARDQPEADQGLN